MRAAARNLDLLTARGRARLRANYNVRSCARLRISASGCVSCAMLRAAARNCAQPRAVYMKFLLQDCEWLRATARSRARLRATAHNCV